MNGPGGHGRGGRGYTSLLTPQCATGQQYSVRWTNHKLFAKSVQVNGGAAAGYKLISLQCEEQSTLDKYLQKFARVKLCLETSLNNSVQSDMQKNIQMLQTQTLL